MILSKSRTVDTEAVLRRHTLETDNLVGRLTDTQLTAHNPNRELANVFGLILFISRITANRARGKICIDIHLAFWKTFSLWNLSWADFN